MILFLTNNRSYDSVLECIEDNELTNYETYTTAVYYGLKDFVQKSLSQYLDLGLKYIMFDLDSFDEDIEEIVKTCESIKIYASDMEFIFMTINNKNLDEIEKYLNEKDYANIITSLEQNIFEKQMLSCLLKTNDENKSEILNWNCKETSIGLYGIMERVGVTTTGVNLANWLNSKGAKVLYVTENEEEIRLYKYITDGENAQNVYEINGVTYCSNIDYIEEKEKFNFIIYDTKALDKVNTCEVRIVCTDISPLNIKDNMMFMKQGYRVGNSIVCLPNSKEYYSNMIKQIENIYMLEVSYELESNDKNEEWLRELLERYYI